MSISAQKITKNIGWLVFDKFFILFLQFIIGIKIANYYGAELYGKYNYAISLVAFSEIFFELINARVIKKFYTEENYNNIVFNISFFRNTIAFVLFFVPIILKFFFEIDNLLFYMLLLICFDNILNSTTFGIENFFEYKLESKRIVISNNVVKVISYSLQFICMIFHMGILIVPIIRCFGSIIRVCILKYQYKSNYLKNQKKEKNKMNKTLILNIITQGKMLWISYVAFLLYTQVDKLMIKYYFGEKEIGIYSIGVNLSAILAIFISPIQNSIYPKMLELYKENYKKYYNFYLKSNTIVVYLYLILILISIFIVNFLFKYIYSFEYYPAITIYNILTISVFTRAIAIFQMGHMVIKNITQKSFYKTLIGLVMNIGLNTILIPKYGINGAAIATVITHFTTAICIDFFIPEYREHFFIQIYSFNLNNIPFKKLINKIVKNKKREQL